MTLRAAVVAGESIDDVVAKHRNVVGYRPCGSVRNVWPGIDVVCLEPARHVEGDEPHGWIGREREIAASLEAILRARRRT